ncbi:MAG: glycosyltransferase family 4 protein [Clostridia bacterium]|nr:glycosyltransferase family 4 protein [Clostridia bacterium]
MRTILVLANSDIGLFRFRKELLRVLGNNYNLICSVPNDGGYLDDLKKIGGNYIETKIERHGVNPFSDIGLFFNYLSMIKKYKPALVLSYTIKPNVYGGMACRLTKTPYIANVTGLGSSLQSGGLIYFIASSLYKIGVKKASCVFFQNESNQKFFVDNKIFTGKTKVIPGSGVNLKDHTFEEYPKDDKAVKFLYVGRIMKDKGVDEMFEAFSELTCKYQNISLDVVGGLDDDYEEEVKKIKQNPAIIFHGQKSAVHNYYKQSHCVVLPSYHEGLSNVLLESAATGRPVIATDIPGCRETFDDGVSGFSCKRKDAKSLLSAVERFINLDYEKKKEMGKAARKKVEKEFDRNIVISAYLEEINNI